MAGLGSALPLLGDTSAASSSGGGAPTVEGELTDDLGVSYGLLTTLAKPVTASDTLNLAPSMAALRGIVLTEVLNLAPSMLPNQIAHLTAADTITILEALVPGIPGTLTETLGLTITQVIQQVTEVIEELNLAEAFSPIAKYGVSYTDTVQLAESLAKFFGGDITETLSLSSTWAGNKIMNEAMTDTLGLAESQTANLIIRVTAEDDLVLDDDQVLRAIYHGNIDEGIEFTAAYISPGGGFTTWAMNTRTAAVTEYQNYDFNGFARIGDKYIGTSATGLYELIGDDDAGDDIIAEIKSGFAQWAGSKFTLFKHAYLGVRGDGDFVLRLITGDGQTYNYAVSTRDMRSTKVHMGKGLRARYFRFELISTGQDFDLDTIEFVPLVTQRRV